MAYPYVASLTKLGMWRNADPQFI